MRIKITARRNSTQHNNISAEISVKIEPDDKTKLSQQSFASPPMDIQETDMYSSGTPISTPLPSLTPPKTAKRKRSDVKKYHRKKIVPDGSRQSTASKNSVTRSDVLKLIYERKELFHSTIRSCDIRGILETLFLNNSELKKVDGMIRKHKLRGFSDPPETITIDTVPTTLESVDANVIQSATESADVDSICSVDSANNILANTDKSLDENSSTFMTALSAIAAAGSALAKASYFASNGDHSALCSALVLTKTSLSALNDPKDPDMTTAISDLNTAYNFLQARYSPRLSVITATPASVIVQSPASSPFNLHNTSSG